MHTCKKILSLSLCMLLLGQNALFAQSQSANARKTLAQYQKEARAEVAQKPQTRSVLKVLLPLGGIVFGAAVLRYAVKRHTNTLEQELKTIASTSKQPVKYGFKPADFDLLENLEELPVKTRNYSVFDPDNYVKLFDKSTPASKRNALLAKLKKEPWLKSAPYSQQKAFLEIVDELMRETQRGHLESFPSRVDNLANLSLPKGSKVYKNIQLLFKKLGKPRNFMILGMFVALGVAANEANAQTMADRINRNFDLFLNATPEELAEMEKHEEVRQVCIEGTKLLSVLSEMDNAELEVLTDLSAAPQTQKHDHQKLLHNMAR